MIISVICPNCGKKIQIDDSNDANICICCNRAFVTEKARKCDEVSVQAPVAAPTAEQPKVQDLADHYYNNAIGLLEKGKDENDDALRSNLAILRKQFPLDPRLQVVEFKLALQSYKKAASHKNGYVKKVFQYLDALAGTDYYDECYNVLKEEAKRVSKSDNEGSLYLKLILQDVKPNAILRYYEGYKREQENYKKAYQIYRDNLAYYERVKNDGRVHIRPVSPISPSRFGDPSISVLKEILPLLRKEENEDQEYLGNKYRELVQYSEAIESITHDYKDVLKGIYKLLSDECKKKLNAEEKARREKIKAKKTAKALSELKKFWEFYISVLKAGKTKDAYKYLTLAGEVEGKPIQTYHELSKFSKSLFSTKYGGNVDELDAEKLAQISFKNMNFSF